MSTNHYLWKIVGSILAGTTFVMSQNCLSRDYGNGGTVCVCNENHCDTIAPVTRLPSHQYLVYTSNKAGERFTKRLKKIPATPQKKYNIPHTDIICEDQIIKEYEICDETEHEQMEILKEGYFNQTYRHIQTKVYIDPGIHFQEIIGFGGAFTDSTGINIRQMSPKLQDHLMRSYFSADGLQYNLCRVPMGGTDFSTRAYSYVDSDEYEVNCVDPLLRNFHLALEDLVYKIPLIQKAMNLTNKNLRLFASTWIAPKAMKENNSYQGTMGFIKEELYQLWADYFVKFLDLYLEYGIPFWGITTGNEPFIAMAALSGIPAVLWIPDDLGRWIRDYLRPTTQKSDHKNINILTLDDQRPLLLHVLPKIFADQATLDFVQGIALHWYLDYDNNTHLLDKIHELYPNKFLLATEGCAGDFVNNVRLGAWDRGERYAKDIIQDLNHWVTGWVDWNMVLNTEGGPTIAGPVDSPIIANVTEFYKQPHYYALGHFSKFITRGSVRIYSSQCDGDNLVDLVALRRPDDGIVVVILNRNNYTVQRTLINFDISDIDLTLTPHSITTVLYWL